MGENGLRLEPSFMVHRRYSGNHAVGFKIVAHSRFCAYDDAVPQPDVAHETYLSGQSDMMTDLGASGNPDLGHDQTVLSDNYIMCDLNQIINLRAPLDNGLAESGPID